MQTHPSRFSSLGPAFYTPTPPTPLPAAHWVGWSERAAQDFGGAQALHPDATTLARLSGNAWPTNDLPLATVYSGHQFGHWAGQLGDGRALLLGDLHTPLGRFEVQLKGAGPTPYSRRGDGRAVLRSSIREFLCSEAMHALGIPSTRALCVTGSPATVWRENAETAAVVTRLAPSFIRFGHFEHFSHRGQHGALRQLADFVIDHFYPQCREADGNPYAALLAQVTERSAALVAAWQAVGFCHGVLNTDNMSILGLTLDYGPFQFMDRFDPDHVCNHSDSQGRYAYARQPQVVYWNLFCLGRALLPLLDNEEQALAALEPYRARFPELLQQAMNRKLGWDAPREGDVALTERLMQILTDEAVDHTIFWQSLTQAAGTEPGHGWSALLALCPRPTALAAWLPDWQQRWQAQADPRAGVAQMRHSNPQRVLRKHLAHNAITAAEAGDFSVLERLQKALAEPYCARPEWADLSDFPPAWAEQLSIGCSS